MRTMLGPTYLNEPKGGAMTIWTEILVIIIIINIFAWFFGVDGEKIISFWFRLLLCIGFFFIIGCIIGLGMKMVGVGVGICP